MSGVSSTTAIAVYLNVAKNEPSQVTKSVAANAPLAATVKSFETTAPTLGSSSAILANYHALQVLTGAYNMSGQLGSTAILKDLMTQSPESSGSLVQETANTDYLHFARATEARSADVTTLGSMATLSLSTGGASASSLTMQNTAWAAATPTAANPGKQWSFVLDDGSAGASIAASLNAASVAAGGKGGYGVTSAGIVTNPVGSLPVTTHTDSAGNTVYTLPISSVGGVVTKSADVVAVKVTAGTSVAAVTAQTTALDAAMNAAGFDSTLSSTGTLSVVDPATAGLNTLARSYGTAIATATATTLDSSGRLDLGAAGKGLIAGQVLTDGSTEIGTVKSVDSFGNVTLTAPAATTVAAGDSIEVATGLALANVGSLITAAAASPAGGSLISLGKTGLSLQPGQIITASGVTIGTIASVDANGNARLLAPSTQAVDQGAALVVLPAVSAASVSGLSDAKNVAGIVSAYETDSYETSMGQQYAGMDDALYYTRTMGSITSISQLMSDSKLLSVVTTGLGMSSYFGELDYDQQVSILTAKVDLKTMTTPAAIQRTSVQYLIATASSQSTAPTGLAALLAGQSQSSTDLLAMINGTTLPSSDSSDSDPILSLFG